MLLIDFLRHHVYRPGRRSELWTVNCQLGPSDCARAGRRGTGRHIAEGKTVHLGVSRGRNPVHSNALIDDRVVVHDVIVDDRSVIVDSVYFRLRQAVVGEIMIVKIVQRDESKMFRTKTEIKVESDVQPVEAVAAMKVKIGVRRKGRPATIVTFGTPGDPGRTPNCIGGPDPPTTVMQKPASIVERGPPPGVIRLPEPARIGVDPMPGIAVGTPVAIDSDYAGLPAPANSAKLNPRTVG